MCRYKRIFTIVVDSFGIGAMPNANEYGDEGCDTLGHIDEIKENFKLPNLAQLGLGRLHPLKHVEASEKVMGYQARMLEASVGKDTMTGHWEMMGLHIKEPFRTFTETGFPPELIRELSERTGHKVIGNKSASGTEILDELAEQEIATGDMIVYTSADSVMQICGNEETFGLEELYRCCEIARELTMKEEWKVGRIIARPYVGKKRGEFKRTSNRHDYAIKPYGRTVLNALKDAGYDVISVGKINDIFCGKGINKAVHIDDNMDGVDKTLMFMIEMDKGLIFTNLVEFDSRWGHRRDVDGYSRGLVDFDNRLPEIISNLRDDDLLIINADHGCDPTFKGTDHTREYIPVLMYGKKANSGVNLHVLNTFADIGQTIADNFGCKIAMGTSRLEEIWKNNII